MPAAPRAFRCFVLCIVVVLGGWLRVPQTAQAQTARAATSKAASPSGLWREADEKPLLAARGGITAKTARHGIIPTQYRTLTLDRARLASLLEAAPEEGVLRKALAEGAPAEALPAPVEIDLPIPHSAVFERFNVELSPIMEPGLAARYPDIRTYVAQGIDNPQLTARLDVTPQGFHATIRSTGGQVLIDPYFPDGSDQAMSIVYYKRDYPNKTPWSCTVADPRPPASRAATANALPPDMDAATGASLRVYRLAVGTTAEYSAAVGGSNVTKTLGAVITVVNRVDAVYERDLAIRMVLVNNEDQIIYTNASTEPYTNANGNTLLGQNQTVCDNVIGSANYDVGHVFSTGGGGVALLGCVCQSGSKAQGVTGLGDPEGDPYAIDYVAHEMGHEFGANHPFNSTTDNCGNGNRNAGTAYEPGSGVTIMAYAGICSDSTNGVQDLAPHSDDYFHTVSWGEITAYTTTGSGKNTVLPSIATGNHPPTITTPTAYTIPISTPFALTATAADQDGDTLTYCWEEFDLGATVNATATTDLDNGAAPIFRSFAPTQSPTRIFPALTYILNNANVPPLHDASGELVGEALPSKARAAGLNFRCTVRDNRANGGGSQFAAVKLAVSTAAGPFAISAPNSGTFAAGASVPVTWAVASTTGAPVSCANVKITLSTDGGLTFPYTLASSVPNSGSATVTLPTAASVATKQGRIKVEAVGNIFFDIDNANLVITSTNTPPTFAASGSGINLVRGTPTAVTATVGTATPGSNPLASASVSGVPDGATVTASLSGNTVMLTATAACRLTTTLGTRTYPINVTVTDTAGATVSGAASLVIAPNPSPTLGTYAANVSFAAGNTVTVRPATAAADANGNLLASPYMLLASPPSGMTLSINQTNGYVTAVTTTTTAQGTVPVRVTLQDTCGAAVVQTFNLIVTAPPATTAPAFTSTAQSGSMSVGSAYQFTFTASGTPAPTFSVTSGTLPAGLTLNPTTGVLSGTLTTPGYYQNIQVTASNGTTPNATQNFALTVYNTLNNYLAGYGLTGANAAPTADPDNDGLANLTEYALNLIPNGSDIGNPLLPSKQTALQAYGAGYYLSIHFTRVPLNADVSYFVETSPDLTTWTIVASSVGGAALSGPGAVNDDASSTVAHTVEARDTVAQSGAAGDRRFIRLRLSKP